MSDEETTERVDDGNDPEIVGTSAEMEQTEDPERPNSASSSASSLVSQTSAQEEEDTELFQRPQQDLNECPEQVAADVSARGILKYKRKLSSDTAFRGLLMSACAPDEDVSRTSESQNEPTDKSEEKDCIAKTCIAEEPQVSEAEQAKPLTKRSSSVSSSSTTHSEGNDAGLVEDKEVSLPQNEAAPDPGENVETITSVPGSSTVEVVTACTQTEWSWLQDSLLYQELMNREPGWSDDRRRTSLGSAGSNKSTGRKYPPRRRSVSRRCSVASDPGKEDNQSILEEAIEDVPEELGKDTRPTAEIRRKSKDAGSSVPRSRQSIVSSLPQTPKGQDALFRPPTVELSSSSSSEDEADYELQQDSLLPSIGPPAILQYIKESQHPPFANEDVPERGEQADLLKKSMNSGPCMFCKEEVLPFPTLEEMETFPANQLYCCPQYERFVKFELAQRGDQAHLVDKLIDVKPHPPYGTKAARRAAKERAAERAREREMERQKAAGANPTNFYSLTRQMKTIAYSLASTKCMEEGWTVRPPSPLQNDQENLQDPFVIEVNPLQLRHQSFLERFYGNGKRFLLLLPDGTGCCYYPSGNVAVLITATEKGKFTYIVYEDDNDFTKNWSGMLAMFEPSGHGTCYFRNGSVRLVLNPYGGVMLDSKGARKKKWLWHNLKDHVHAPPFQPITFTISRQLAIRCLSQHKVVLTFNQGRHTARFNVGTKLKAVVRAKPPVARDDHDLYLAEVKQFVNILLDRTQTALRLPKYPQLDKIPLPKHLQKITRDDGRKSKLRSTQPAAKQPDKATVTVN